MYNWNLGPDLLLCVSVLTDLCLHKAPFPPLKTFPAHTVLPSKSSHQISDSKGEERGQMGEGGQKVPTFNCKINCGHAVCSMVTRVNNSAHLLHT